MPPLHPSQLEVVVDTREQAPWDFTAYGMKMRSGTVKFGDYTARGFERFIAVERKSAEDFIGCMTTRREEFEKVLIALRGYCKHVVVVEYGYDKMMDDFQRQFARSRMHYNSVLGTIAAWTGRYRIHFAGNRARAEEYAARFILKAAQDIYAPIEHLAPMPAPDSPATTRREYDE